MFLNYPLDIQCHFYFTFLHLCLRVDDHCLQGLTMLLDTETGKPDGSVGKAVHIGISQMSFKFREYNSFSHLREIITALDKVDCFDLVQSVPLTRMFILPLALCPTSCISKNQVYLFKKSSS